MKIKIGQPRYCCEIGQRANNEDYIYPAPELATTANRLFLVCDGMGGHERGEVASELVARTIADYWIVNSELPDTDRKVQAAIREAIRKLEEQNNGGNTNMGTTLTLASIGEEQVMIAHVGDSRVYQIRPGGGIIYHTRDHSVVQRWVDAGVLTPEEARTHPKKNMITRAVQAGVAEGSVADVVILTDIEDGDYLFLCTDGVTGAIDDPTLVEMLEQEGSDALKMEAIQTRCRNDARDNYSAYLIPLAVEKDEHDIWKEAARDTDNMLTPDDRRCLRNQAVERQARQLIDDSDEKKEKEWKKSLGRFLVALKEHLQWLKSNNK